MELARPPFPLARMAAIWAVLSGIIVAMNAYNIAAREFPDPDDILRLVQVRDLLAGQDWFDLHQYRLDPPHGTLMHWSRLVDIPLAAILGSLTWLLGPLLAETVTIVLVPLLTLGVVLAVVCKVADRFFSGDEVTFAGLALGLSPLFVAQIQPLRIDHHGWQVACVMVALLGLLPGRRGRGAVLSGVALAFGLSISLEILPHLAAFGLVFGLRWLVHHDRRSLPTFLLTLTATLGALFLATRGLVDLAAHCDAVSPVHLAVFSTTTLATLAVAAVDPRSRLAATGLLGLSAAAGLAVLLTVTPECVSGPFGNLEPEVRHFWYENVLEGLPVWHVPAALAVPVVIGGIIALVTLARLIGISPPEERQWWTEYLIIAAVGFVAAVLTWRSQAFVGALSAVPIGWLTVRLLERLRTASTLGRKGLGGLSAVLILLPSAPTALAKVTVGESTVQTGAMSKVTDSTCALTTSVPLLNRIPAGTALAPLDIGPELLGR
ncbi:MAG: hypothetical protein B7Z08_05440, partial [Sphingomonadales bacterium 32-68-7]